MSKEKIQKNYGFVVAETEALAREKAIEKFPELADKKFKLRQDEDVFDTWFSSWLWPLSVFDGINNPDNEDINYYYPTNDLVTAPEIIFFWVARMIMAGYEYNGKECFKNVYFTGIVRDKLGRKMSKSLGNSPDPLELINKYGADGVRMGMLLTSPAGNDLPFDENLCEQGRNFNNKIWNSFRLVKGWEVADIAQPNYANIAVKWFESTLAKTVEEVDDLFSKYRLSEALMTIYKLFWDEFSAWYLELIKPAFGQPIDKKTFDITLHFFDSLLKLLHPFMPFITEELWQSIAERKQGESIMFASLNNNQTIDSDLLQNFEISKEIIANIRNLRQQKNISPKEKLSLHVAGKHNTEFDDVIEKMANITPIYPNLSTDGKLPYFEGKGWAFLVGVTEYTIPLDNLINAEEEIKKIESDIKYYESFLATVLKKLSNEKFVANAKPEVVEMERKKQSDTQTKLQTLHDSLKKLKG